MPRITPENKVLQKAAKDPATSYAQLEAWAVGGPYPVKMGVVENPQTDDRLRRLLIEHGPAALKKKIIRKSGELSLTMLLVLATDADPEVREVLAKEYPHDLPPQITEFLAQDPTRGVRLHLMWEDYDYKSDQTLLNVALNAHRFSRQEEGWFTPARKAEKQFYLLTKVAMRRNAPLLPLMHMAAYGGPKTSEYALLSLGGYFTRQRFWEYAESVNPKSKGMPLEWTVKLLAPPKDYMGVCPW